METADIYPEDCTKQINTLCGGNAFYERWKPSTTNLEEEEIVDAPGNDGNASMPEQVNQPNPRRKMMMMMNVKTGGIYSYHCALDG